MKIPFVNLNRQYNSLKEGIDSAIAGVIEKSSFIRGKPVEEFELRFAESLGAKYCVSCANGTDALYIGMKSLGLSSGDEVITTAHTWISSSETITQAGGKVRFCDTAKGSFLMDLSKLPDLVNERTKGIIVVHLAGEVVDMEKVSTFAKKHGLWIIEDCAQAHLAKFKGQNVGTMGDIGTFSFYPGKNLGAMGDAGAIVSNRKELADWMTLFARHGGKGDHQIEGINSRMDGLQAAILNVKLPKLEEWNSQRKAIAAEYTQRLSGIGKLECPSARPNIDHVYHLYMIQIDRRDELRAFLSEQGIQTGINYPKALPFYKAYRYLNHSPSCFPNAHRNQSRILSLPLYPLMEEREVEYVSDTIIEFFGS